MSVAILNAQTITEFLGHAEPFDRSVEEQFQLLDTNGDGMLSCVELRRGLDESLGMEHEAPTEDQENDLYAALFARFDEDNDGAIEPEGFRSLFREMMLALARGIGGTPVLMVLQPESLFDKAVQHELEQRKKNQISTVSASTLHNSISPRAKARKPRSPGGGLLVCFFCGAHSTKKDDS